MYKWGCSALCDITKIIIKNFKKDETVQVKDGLIDLISGESTGKLYCHQKYIVFSMPLFIHSFLEIFVIWGDLIWKSEV